MYRWRYNYMEIMSKRPAIIFMCDSKMIHEHIAAFQNSTSNYQKCRRVSGITCNDLTWIAWLEMYHGCLSMTNQYCFGKWVTPKVNNIYKNGLITLFPARHMAHKPIRTNDKFKFGISFNCRVTTHCLIGFLSEMLLGCLSNEIHQVFYDFRCRIR